MRYIMQYAWPFRVKRYYLMPYADPIIIIINDSNNYIDRSDHFLTFAQIDAWR